MIRCSLILLIGALLGAGCAGNRLRPADFDDAVARIRTILPPDWTILTIKHDTYPFYRPEGKGTAVFLAPSKLAQRKTDYQGVIYLMPLNYADGGEDPTHRQAQTSPARLIGRSAHLKVYLWSGWPQADTQLRDALQLK